MFERSKSFPYLVGISALSVAGSAAFYSVYGLSKLFAGAQLAVIIMAGSLEFAKLVTASFLYRYWDRINSFMKTYMIVGVVTLVLITSMGIFGFLSNAYQGATVVFEKESTKLIYKEDRLDQLKSDKAFLLEELEAQVASLPDNYITAKRKLRADYNPKIQEINTQMLDLKGEIGDLKTALVETGVDVGPAIYLARIFDTEIDTIVKFFIFMLIFVFDPLAVVLVIAFNQTLELRENSLPQKSGAASKKPVKDTRRKWWKLYGEKKPLVSNIKDIFNIKKEVIEEPIELEADPEDLPIIDEDERGARKPLEFKSKKK